MKRIRTLLHGRKLFLTMMLAIVAVGVFVATIPTAEAVAGPALCSYYKDATYKKVIGGRGTGCCGEPISWGQTSLYVKCQQLLCPDVLCPF
jgi:hypothetical protein